MYRVKKEFLWFPTKAHINPDDHDPEHIKVWLAKGHIEDIDVAKLEEEAEAKLKGIEADLKDDGKLNYSNDPKKNSPGRPKKKKSKKKK